MHSDSIEAVEERFLGCGESIRNWLRSVRKF